MKSYNKTCLKCGTEEQLTNHHVVPLSAFPSRLKNKHKVCLCRDCHNSIEIEILSTESLIGNVRYGLRYKLHHSEYYQILKDFLNEEVYYTAV